MSIIGDLVKFVPKANIVLHYDVENNVMRDENEYTIFDIFHFITPNELFLFKHNQTNMIVGKPGKKVTLIYLE